MSVGDRVASWVDGLNSRVMNEEALEQRVRDVIDEQAEFYDMDLEYPEFTERDGWGPAADPHSEPQEFHMSTIAGWLTRIPYRSDPYEEQARYLAYHQVVQDVVERNPDAVREYYHDELAELEPALNPVDKPVEWGKEVLARHTGFGRDIGTGQGVPSRHIYDHVLDDMDDGRVASLVLGTNEETDTQVDRYVQNARFNPVRQAAIGAVTAGLGYFSLQNAIPAIQQYGMDFAAYLGSLRADFGLLIPTAIVGGTLLHEMRDAVGNEPLTDERLAQYDPVDRRRALLYNNHVASDLDSFLAELDDRGIE